MLPVLLACASSAPAPTTPAGSDSDRDLVVEVSIRYLLERREKTKLYCLEVEDAPPTERLLDTFRGSGGLLISANLADCPIGGPYYTLYAAEIVIVGNSATLRAGILYQSGHVIELKKQGGVWRIVAVPHSYQARL